MEATAFGEAEVLISFILFLFLTVIVRFGRGGAYIVIEGGSAARWWSGVGRDGDGEGGGGRDRMGGESDNGT